jgi:superfamily II DNA or RNA helicase
MPNYSEFLARKAVRAPLRGLTEIPQLADYLFDFQRGCVEFGLRTGSWGLFLDTGLGKTACELEWCRHAIEQSNGRALVLAPLAVGWQIVEEGKRWGYEARVVRQQSDVRDGINVCNYDRLGLLDPSSFGAVALDESSVLKHFGGNTSTALIDAFSGHRWRMCATATPAPNDHTELGQHSEFLGVLRAEEMLIRWFVHDSADTGIWRLKGHAREAYWDWLASWSRMAAHPSDLGDNRAGFDLPALNVVRHDARGAADIRIEGSLFAENVSATTMHDIKRQTAEARCTVAMNLAYAKREPCVIWCDTDYESNALLKLVGTDAIEVRGSQSIDEKEEKLRAFAAGEARVLISKPSICGHGLNWQHCSTVIFVGRSFSYESYYQAVRRCWRFGQQRPVTVHLIIAEGEWSIGRVIDRKADDHVQMKIEMVAAMRRASGRESVRDRAYAPTHEGRLPAWL